ncbi:hypothetical protein OTU49_008745, partial [Cherax quadricarinatus]
TLLGPFCILILFLVSPGNSLRCINCTSLRDARCLDGVGSEQECADTENYCVSYTGYLKKGQAQVLFRACTETNMSHFCGVHFENLTHNRVERLIACYRTCNTDLCNTHHMEYINQSTTAVFHSLPLAATALLAAVSTLAFRLCLDT